MPVVDAQGKVYSPPRLLGVKTAVLKERWADLQPQTLLMASEAKALRMAQWTRLQEGSSANDGNSSSPVIRLLAQMKMLPVRRRWDV